MLLNCDSNTNTNSTNINLKTKRDELERKSKQAVNIYHRCEEQIR